MPAALEQIRDLRARSDYAGARATSQSPRWTPASRRPALLIELGRLSKEFGDYDRAVELLERARSMPGTTAELRAHASAWLIIALASRGDYDDAERAAQEGLAEAERALPPDSLARRSS